MIDRFVREPECKRITGLSRTTRWRLERAGLFPKRRQISPGLIAWLESEVQEWLRDCAENEEAA
ncbi:MAG: AlpA family phage regulatory protein [Candidatus Brocadiales bacterium]|nr:AlpA family phage regulatory protein [Candidatus Bathyanammoxibius sp.]